MHELGDEKAAFASDRNKLEVIFMEMVQMCLWFACAFVYYDPQLTCSPTGAMLRSAVIMTGL